MRVLLLDSTYFPIKIVNWQKAIILLLTERAELVEIYPCRYIHSVSKKLSFPKIIKLYRKHKTSKQVKFCRENVFLRDKLRCQYCSIKLPMKKLTIDHVVPISKGGTSDWENVVSSCASCNSKKANKNLDEIHMKLLSVPRKPKWSPGLCLKLRPEDPEEWGHWIPTLAC